MTVMVPSGFTQTLHSVTQVLKISPGPRSPPRPRSPGPSSGPGSGSSPSSISLRRLEVVPWFKLSTPHEARYPRGNINNGNKIYFIHKCCNGFFGMSTDMHIKFLAS